MKLMTVMVAAAVLSGCTSYEERVAATCARLGAGPGTANYWRCVEMQHAQDAQQRMMWGGLAATGFGIAAQPAPQPVTCSTWGGMTTCR